MHTSTILRTEQFRVEDENGAPVALTDDLRIEHRLGIVSPRYEDAIVGASGIILAFVTAYYDLQRARAAETGQPFFVYPDYFAFVLGAPGADGTVRGQAGAAPLAHGVRDAYGGLDIWPDEKWIVAPNGRRLWQLILAYRITHLLLPADPGPALGAVPEAVQTTIRTMYRYLLPGPAATGAGLLRLKLASEPVRVIGQAVAYLPDESPAHKALPLTVQRLLRWG